MRLLFYTGKDIFMNREPFETIPDVMDAKQIAQALHLSKAGAYSSIGMGKLRELTNDKHCNFVLWVGNKRLIKKRLFDKYIEQAYSI